jgi:hypothetical protein
MAENKICFVISPIGELNSDTRRRSDQILRHVISPAAKECGYEAIRADQIAEPGLITSQVIQHVVSDPLVIADLSERNANVFYELAVRHAIKKPLVQIVNKGETLPFDIAGTRTISVDHRDLDSVEAAKNEIINQIKSLETSSSEIDTPISVALDLKVLRQSENPEQRSLADILGSIADLQRTTVILNTTLQKMREDFKGQLESIAGEIDMMSVTIRESAAQAKPNDDSSVPKRGGNREPRW